jgi:Clostridium epsilon toxin ETX/Bacillus mosquitocidal toxin MTX2
MKLRHHRIALAVACLSATAAWADRIDVNAMIVDQLRKSGKLAAIYKAKTGENLPANLNASAVFEGEIGGRGVRFTIPSVIPENPLVISQAPVTNCSSREVTRTVGVNKSSTNSSTISTSDTVETGQEISVTVGYDSPFGASASATASAHQSFSATKSTEQSTSETLGWSDQLAVPVEAGKMVKVQFVVTEQRLDRIPFTANLVLTGNASINFLRGQEGFSWVTIAGSSLPPNVIHPGHQQNGRPLAVCRVTANNRVRIGKSEGTTCWYALSEMLSMPMFKSGTSTSNFDILVGSDSSVRLGDPYATDAYTTDDPSHSKVCFVQTNEGWLEPGYVDGRKCIWEYDSHVNGSEKYQVLRAAVTGGVTASVRLEDQLTEAQRTFDLRGVFTGANAIFGDFRVGPSNPAVCDEVKTASVNTVGAASVNALGMSAAKSAALPVTLGAAAPNEAPLPAKAGAKKVLPRR